MKPLIEQFSVNQTFPLSPPPVCQIILISTAQRAAVLTTLCLRG